MSDEINKKWFKSAIKKAGFKSQAVFAEHVKLDSTKLSNILRGIRRITPKEIDRFSAALNVTPSEIREALGEEVNAPPLMNISGYVGAADRVFICSDGSDVVTDEFIQIPFYYYKGILLEIRGESMLPRYNPGEIIGITIPVEGYIDDSLIGRDVVARLSDDSYVLKILHRGSEKGKYTLISINPSVPPIIDTKLLWASPIDFLIPMARNRKIYEIRKK